MYPMENLLEFKLELLEVSTPGGSYVSVNTRGNIAYVTIQFPIENGAYLFLIKGKLLNNSQKLEIQFLQTA